MASDLTITQIVEFLDCGDGVHRFHAPARALAGLEGVTVVDCDPLHRCFPELARETDVLVMAAFNSDLFSIFEGRRLCAAGRRVTVVEANDYYPDLQPWNPLSMRWLDRSLQDSFHHALRVADGIQVSVPALITRWARLTDRPQAAFRNHFETVPPLSAPRTGPLTVGWGGSPGHFADWFSVAPVLERWLARRPDVRLAVMTNVFARDFVRVDPSRLVFRDFGSLDDWLGFVEGLDIGLAPLLPTEYNRCRSDVKFLEYASRGVAGVYRRLDPYLDSVVHGETGMLYDTDDDLLACLDALADDAALRARIRERAHAYLTRERILSGQVGERLDFYRALGAQPGGGVSEAVLARGARDGAYVRFLPEAPERALRHATEAPASAEIEASLSALVAAFPDYLAAWQQLAQVRSTLRSPRTALDAAERAIAIDATRARSHTEAGRARWLLGDTAGAWQSLERAVAENPQYAPAWFAMISLYKATGAQGAVAKLAQARAHLPFSYGLVLASLSLHPADAQVGALGGLLDETRFTPEEEPVASPAFAASFEALPASLRESADGRQLLRRLCERFPASGRLARLRASIEEATGDAGEGARERLRAAALEESARLFEAARIDPSRAYFWQFAEHVRAHRAAASSAETGGAAASTERSDSAAPTPLKASPHQTRS